MKKSFLLLTIIAGFLLFSQCAQNNTAQVAINANRAVSKNINPDDEVRVESDFNVPELADGSLDAVLSVSPPEIRLIILCQGQNKDCREAYKVELPDDARELLKEYWKKVLTNRYEHDFVAVKTPENVIRLDEEQLGNFVEFERSLRKLNIDAAEGRRNISITESAQIAKFTTKCAFQVLKKAKSL